MGGGGERKERGKVGWYVECELGGYSLFAKAMAVYRLALSIFLTGIVLVPNSPDGVQFLMARLQLRQDSGTRLRSRGSCLPFYGLVPLVRCCVVPFSVSAKQDPFCSQTSSTSSPHNPVHISVKRSLTPHGLKGSQSGPCEEC